MPKYLQEYEHPNVKLLDDQLCLEKGFGGLC